MNIYHGLEAIKAPANAVVTSGTFDGVHIGHQKILKRLIELARKINGETVVITFWPHPRFVLYPDESSIQLLSTFEEKEVYLEEIGVDHLIKIPFTKEFSQLCSNEFIQQILCDKIGTRKLVIGYDHRFGKNREGSFDYLAQNASFFGFEVEEIPKQEIDHIGVSSTKIRNALANGEVEIASQFLGKDYSLTGEVVEGDQIGRNIGFPTANLFIKERFKLIPADGTYAVRISRGAKSYNGMLNIGFRPTVKGQTKTIETNIFDFDEWLYGEMLTVQFVKQIRKELKFEDLGALKDQLSIDKAAALKILK